MSAIAWGEGDVRDAMREFDPGATDFSVFSGWLGLRAYRNEVLVCVYWAYVPMAAITTAPNSVDKVGCPSAHFHDPIEAIQYALGLVRKGQQ